MEAQQLLQSIEFSFIFICKILQVHTTEEQLTKTTSRRTPFYSLCDWNRIRRKVAMLSSSGKITESRDSAPTV
jgi:hypothetical protein